MPLKLSNRLFKNLSRFSAESVNIPWIGFFAIVVGFDLFLNTIFAVLYLLDANAIAGVKEVGFKVADEIQMAIAHAQRAL